MKRYIINSYLNEFNFANFQNMHPVDRKRVQFITDQILHNFNLTKDVHLLDCGCGSAGFSANLAENGLKVDGFDLSERNINNGKNKYPFKNLNLFVGDVYEIENLLPDNTYDIVICSEILEHIHKPELVLNALRKKVKKNHLILIMVPNGRGPSEIHQAVTTALKWFPQSVFKSITSVFGLFSIIQARRGKELYPEGGHVKYYNFKQWLGFIEKSKLDVIQYSLTMGWAALFSFTMHNKKMAAKSCIGIDYKKENNSCGFWFACKFKEN